jgi:DNA-binding MarR family transcriptional regulator
MKIKKFISQSPIFSLYLAASEVVEHFQKNLVNFEVHFLQGLILTAIFFEDKEVRPLELSHVFQVERSTLSHAIRGLEKKGWLKRNMHPTDARGYVLSLTSSGRKKALALIKEFDQVHDGIEQNIGVRKLKESIDNINAVRKSYSEYIAKSQSS